MSQVIQTPEGPGVVKETRHTVHGGTEYYVVGRGGIYEGWYRQAELDGVDDYDPSLEFEYTDELTDHTAAAGDETPWHPKTKGPERWDTSTLNFQQMREMDIDYDAATSLPHTDEHGRFSPKDPSLYGNDATMTIHFAGYEDDSDGCPHCGNSRLASFFAGADVITRCGSCGWDDSGYQVEASAVDGYCPECGYDYLRDGTSSEVVCDDCGWQGNAEDVDETPDPEDTRYSSHTASVRKASWADVRAKASRLRSSGNVSVDSFHPASLHCTVQGDNGTYNTSIFRIGEKGATDTKVSGWACSCEWGHQATLRPQGSRYLGRMCSHALAAYWEMQSRSNRKSSAINMVDEFGDEMHWEDALIADPRWGYATEGGEDYLFAELADELGMSLDDVMMVADNSYRVAEPGTVFAKIYDGNEVELNIEGQEFLPVTQETTDVHNLTEDGDWHTYTATHEAEDHTYDDIEDDDDELEAFGEPKESGWVTRSSNGAESEDEILEEPEDEDDEGEGTPFDTSRKSAAEESTDEDDLSYLMEGGSDSKGDDDIARAAEAHLAKVAGRYYTPEEQEALINEAGYSEEAINKLNLQNSSYLLP